MFIACEIFGPLNSNTVLDIALWMIQCLFNTGFNCIVSLQLIQFCNIFGVTLLNDWPESKQLFLSRILVFPLGLVIGSGLCSVRAGACKKSPIYDYFITDDSLKTNDNKFSLLSGISWFLYGTIIILFQMCIEVKRLFLNRADQRADNLALNARNQIQKAVNELKLQNLVELGSKNLFNPDIQISTLGLYPRLLQHLKVSRTLNKVLPLSTPKFVERNVQSVIRNAQLMNIEEGIISAADGNVADNISVIQESPVQEVNQSLDGINNSRSDQQGDDRIDLSGSFQGPHQEAFPAWQKNYINKSDHEMPILVTPKNKLARDQVKDLFTITRLQKLVSSSRTQQNNSDFS